jgi:uncharacterized protein
MAATLRVVIDPGVLVSAAIAPGGAPGRLIEAWRDGRIEMIVSPGLLAELKGVLRRDKFRKYLTIGEAERYVALIRREADLRADPPDVPRVTADPKDDYLLALGVATSADLVISGDPHLTQVERPRSPVMTPAGLAELLAVGD